MPGFLRRRIAPLTIVAASASLLMPALAAGLDGVSLSAGSFTVAITDQRAYSEPAPVLSLAQWRQFMAGRSVFQRQWASIVSLDGDWGLGPTFVADRCVACHINSGRGHPPDNADQQPLSMLVRLSIPGLDAHGGPRPHPDYGDQIQNRSLDGSTVDLAHGGTPVPREADVYIDWQEQEVVLPDGTAVQLRQPQLRIENPAFGPLDGVMTSLRVAQPLVGIGFLDAVPEETIRSLAQAQQALGFNGRPNHVWDAVNQRSALGRYGWKANVPGLRQQIAAAAIADMGVNTNLYPEQNCPPVQTVCQQMLPGNFPELVDVEIDSLTLWMQALAVPARRGMSGAQVQLGEQMFERARCSVCHVPELVTAASFPQLPQLANQTFHAYTDLLLHDMGEGLADGRPDFQAGPRDWRTPPLWGLGLSHAVTGRSTLLHDGRARSVTEAILWHGGEAAVSRDAFSRMTKRERDALVSFVEAI